MLNVSDHAEQLVRGSPDQTAVAALGAHGSIVWHLQFGDVVSEALALAFAAASSAVTKVETSSYAALSCS
jgi:hypothetical protein